MQKPLVSIYRGTYLEVGKAMGAAIGRERLEENINKMLTAVDHEFGLNYQRLQAGAMGWLESLPEEYQEELQGIALGSGCSLERLAEWYYCDSCIDNGCTSFIVRCQDDFWVGRNNDYLLPKEWGFVTVLAVTGKIPVMLLGLEGSSFSGTGYNKEKLWLHYNWLPVWDEPGQDGETVAPYVFLRMALENCETLADVEHLLKSVPRDGGMNLFVVDGKSNQAAVFECTCVSHQKRNFDTFVAAANHYCVIEAPGSEYGSENSRLRQARVEQLLHQYGANLGLNEMIAVLADDKVEQRGATYGTVYANLACPARNKLWYAYNDFPAASQSKWVEIKPQWFFSVNRR